MLSKYLTAREVVTRVARTLGTVATQPAPQADGVPELPPCDFVPQKYTGIPLERINDIRDKHFLPIMQPLHESPTLFHQGHMQYLWDHEGNRYLDMFAGIATVNVGHCHPRMVAAVKEQANKLWHTTTLLLQPKLHEYAEKLVSKLPGDLKVVYFVNSGSEACDLALLMARLYTGEYAAVSLRNGYHGASPYVMGLSANSAIKQNIAGGFGTEQTMNPDVYRGLWGGQNCRDSPVQADRQCDCAEGHCKACDMYIEQLDDVMKFSLPQRKLAAFFVEPIQGLGGVVQYPKGYVKKAFEMVREEGGICISDEVQTGFGRTGDLWGFEGHDVVPDMVMLAKSMANGFPLGAVVTTPEIAAKLTVHFNTFSGNPTACAAASEVLDILDDENLPQRAREIGTYLLQELSRLRDEFSIVGDVRGKGLMIGIEMVSDKETKKPLDDDKVGAIVESAKDMNLLVCRSGLYGNVVRLLPPLCITAHDVDFAVAVLRKAIEQNL